jgi:hypothetical protein
MSEPPPRKASFSRMTIVIAFLIAMVSAGCLVSGGRTMPLNNERPRGAATWLARILGAVLVLIGVVLIVGGAWLVALLGSPYYVLAGLGLLASGGLLVLRRITGRLDLCGVFVPPCSGRCGRSG